ncbi:PEP-CTERM sorting domain-containing protein [Duganella sp. FT135W]|uniref:PEP-CTERM sorting domain-containing protein n=1 Tax=Duganella flavida TaxID=2692175 RepID=A0A6L8K336_9BURK|nr:PEP-CTERM sorting domain-containing protein [Duganella flavida]MYM21315.1 PEP-CTERM sorting domain-containing protein [Duganella flavida]
MKHTAHAWLLGSLIFGLPCLNAAAKVDTSVTLTGLKITVSDPTPNDGLAAGFIANASGSSQYSVIASNGQTASYQDNGSSSSYGLPASGTNLSSALSQSIATFGGGYLGDISAAAHTSDEFVQSAIPFAGPRADVNASYGLFVKPHTVLTITGLLSMHASSTEGALLPNNSLEVHSGLGFSASPIFPYLTPGISELYYHSDALDLATGQASGSLSKDWSYTFTNNSDVGGTLELQWFIRSDIYLKTSVVPTTPVPEPDAWLMFGAGALLLGALARRRQRRG